MSFVLIIRQGEVPWMPKVPSTAPSAGGAVSAQTSRALIQFAFLAGWAPLFRSLSSSSRVLILLEGYSGRHRVWTLFGILFRIKAILEAGYLDQSRSGTLGAGLGTRRISRRQSAPAPWKRISSLLQF